MTDIIHTARIGYHPIGNGFGIHFEILHVEDGTLLPYTWVFSWDDYADTALAVEWLSILLRDAKVLFLHDLIGLPVKLDWTETGTGYGDLCVGFSIVKEAS